MVRDTVAHLRAEGRRVFLDAEHFFDGYTQQPGVRAGGAAGRRPRPARTSPCSATPTAGGCPTRSPTSCTRCARRPVPGSASTATTTPAARSPTRSPPSTPARRTCRARSTATASAPATPTCSPSSPTSSSSWARLVLPEGRLRGGDPGRARGQRARQRAARTRRQPYVGASAFAHKAGLHASAVRVDPMLYQHEDPESVGNDMRMLVSDMAGRAAIELKGRELGYDLSGDDRRCSAGSPTGSRRWRRAATRSRPPTRPSSCCCARRSRAPRRTSSRSSRGGSSSTRTATRAPAAGDRRGDREGAGPAASGVRRGRRGQRSGQRARPRAAHRARRRPTRSSPSSSSIDYRVRIVDAAHGTDAVTRVLVETTDGETSWETVGVHANIIEASWEALLDAVTYGLLRHRGRRPTPSASAGPAEPGLAGAERAEPHDGRDHRHRQHQVGPAADQPHADRTSTRNTTQSRNSHGPGTSSPDAA